jgi:hypothetical protein
MKRLIGLFGVVCVFSALYARYDSPVRGDIIIPVCEAIEGEELEIDCPRTEVPNSKCEEANCQGEHSLTGNDRCRKDPSNNAGTLGECITCGGSQTMLLCKDSLNITHKCKVYSGGQSNGSCGFKKPAICKRDKAAATGAKCIEDPQANGSGDPCKIKLCQ